MKSLDIFSMREFGLVDAAGMCGTCAVASYIALLKDADTRLKSHESGNPFADDSFFSFGGFEGLLEYGNFMHTELLYPHRMILEDL